MFSFSNTSVAASHFSFLHAPSRKSLSSQELFPTSLVTTSDDTLRGFWSRGLRVRETHFARALHFRHPWREGGLGESGRDLR